jgi:hypothetical protein
MTATTVDVNECEKSETILVYCRDYHIEQQAHVSDDCCLLRACLSDIHVREMAKGPPVRDEPCVAL